MDSAVVRDWLKSLGALASGSLTSEEVAARLQAFAPLLAAEFDARAFTAASLRAVAAECKFFPTYGELVSHLRDFLAANRPLALPPSAHDPKALTREDEISLRIFANHRADGFSHIDGPNKLAVSLHVLRRYQPRAYAHLIATDTECSAIAVQRRWVHEPQPAHRTPEEIAHAEQVARDTIAAIRGANDPRPA